MFSIGQISRHAGVKVPTIRYYEDIGLLPCQGRSAGGQRRYDQNGLDRLRFIAHARALGLPLAAIRALLELSAHPELHSNEAHEIAKSHLQVVQKRIASLQRLEAELKRITQLCDGAPGPCKLLDALADHSQCSTAH